MKLFKILFSYLPLLFLFFYIFISSNETNINNPNSLYSQKIDNLNKVLNLAETKFTIKEISTKRQEVELMSGNTIAFVSLNQDLYSQVATLQNILKTAKIEGKYVELIDLTSQNPYATLKDN